MLKVDGKFYPLRDGARERLIADLTKFYDWGPQDAWNLTVSELHWWHTQCLRHIEARKRAIAEARRR